MRATQLAPTVTTLIRMDHSHALLTFRRYHVDTPPALKRGLVDTVCLALEVHAQLEEEIFYPAMAAADPGSEVLAASVPEHDEMRRLIGELRALEPTNPAFDTTFMELMRDVLHHVADEETVLLPKAEALMKDQLRPLGAQMLKRRAELVAPRAGELAGNLVRATPASKWLALLGGILVGAYAVGRHTAPGARAA